MKFPEFNSNMKQHMPFIGTVNDNPEFLVCLAEMNSKNWKIYRYHKKYGYVRLTNAPDNVIECNPSVEQIIKSNLWKKHGSCPLQYQKLSLV